MSGFAHLDRVITAPAARGRGIAAGLYRALFAEVVAAGLGAIACEVNAEPPNPDSDAFHEALGSMRLSARPAAG